LNSGFSIVLEWLMLIGSLIQMRQNPPLVKYSHLGWCDFVEINQVNIIARSIMIWVSYPWNVL